MSCRKIDGEKCKKVIDPMMDKLKKKEKNHGQRP